MKISSFASGSKQIDLDLNNYQGNDYVINDVIFEPPYITPHIAITPFTNEYLEVYKDSSNKVNRDVLSSIFGDKFTILPRAIYCIDVLIKYLNIKKDQNVAVYKTFDNDYISRCVSEVISSHCKVERKITGSTKSVMVIHEFGYPYKRTIELRERCKKMNIPFVENCAWTINSKINEKYKVGDIGDFAIFSLPKILPMQFGGILKGVFLTDKTLKKNNLYDEAKISMITNKLLDFMPRIKTYNNRRLDNCRYLGGLIKKGGYDLLIELERDVYPAMLLVKTKNYEKLYERYMDFGVEVLRYYHEKALGLPIHQNLTKNQLDYIYAIFSSYKG